MEPEILIIGGGLNGAALALALASGDFKVTVLDAAPSAALTDKGFDGRATALAASSVNLMRALEVWPDLEADAQPMTDILVSDGRPREPQSARGGAAPYFLHFDHRAIGDAPFGWLVENRHLRTALMQRAQDNPLIDWRGGVKARYLGEGRAQTPSGEIKAQLVVACDGRNSPSAHEAGIRYTQWRYNQSGIVCTVEHERPHHGVAHEYFLPSGPFAILPLTGNRSSLVWTERPDIARAVLALDEAGFNAEMRRRFGDFLGEAKATGPRWSYPLSFALAHQYCAPRLALVGDAAHAIHPIAGQGFNLGLRDAAALAELVYDASRRGEDMGGAAVLEDYQRARRFDNALMAFGMDAMNRLFSNDFPPLRLVRDIGLGLVNRAAPMRDFFMRQAAGLGGDEQTRPRLLRGERL